ncbi:hypothetical protein CYMTET_49832 [Cymbomonas tetramitiformis]|uniref:Uncharacterized protein n=1 Tax=Cymbomonas tetramitiformis TaxID=36881 RepID=A0AAE0BQK0_9CHLO|nr:hypothetical protein CYMTET_49832 [Cymbomonas tetramitiformis]
MWRCRPLFHLISGSEVWVMCKEWRHAARFHRISGIDAVGAWVFASDVGYNELTGDIPTELGLLTATKSWRVPNLLFTTMQSCLGNWARWL